MGFEEFYDVCVEVMYCKDYGFKMMGCFVEQCEEGKYKVFVWEIEEFVDLVVFIIVCLFYEKFYEFDGLLKFIMFGMQQGYMLVDKIEQYLGDIINVINYFQKFFDLLIWVKELNVIFIVLGYGQVGEGFIYILDGIVQVVVQGCVMGGVCEVFLVYEVVYEWWGYQFLWVSYCDQWFSEGFVEYLLMMFVEVLFENGVKIFEQMFKVYYDEMNGLIGLVFGVFVRFGFVLFNNVGCKCMGLIGYGSCVGMYELLVVYQLMVYIKGVFVVYMLCCILCVVMKSDEIFINVLCDFVCVYQGGLVLIIDLQVILIKYVNLDWMWFFDQWVYGMVILIFKVKDLVEKVGDVWVFKFDVEMIDVLDGFKMLVLVCVEFGGNKSGELFIMVDQVKKIYELKLLVKLKKIEFNLGYVILVKMKQRVW